MNNEEYGKFVAARAKKSPMGKDCLLAFLVGGSICVVGQLFRDIWLSLGLGEEASAAVASVSLIGLSVLLTGLGVYDRLARHAGAGTLVPITGFANAMAAPAMEFRGEGLVAGLACNMFRIAGPVLVYGLSASVVYGVILWALG